MKSFVFTDLYGKKHCLPPSFFSSSPCIEGLDFLYLLSDSVKSDLAEYAVKAHGYITARLSKRQSQEKVYYELFKKISSLCSASFPDTPLYEVLDAFGNAHALNPVYRHHVAFCRGYVPVSERENPPVEFYFGTFGGGFAYYREFSTRYRYRHLILLSSWWFHNGNVFDGVNESKIFLFEIFCRHRTFN